MYRNSGVNNFKLCPAIDREKLKNPCISIVGKRDKTYLWVGENDDKDNAKFCFGTMQGIYELRKLANSILIAIEK